MPSSETWDLVVVGGGPAGSTLAGLVKKYDPAARVLVIEKAAFPRHHVGESLLPGLLPVLKELGVFDKLNAHGFPRKIGAVFVWGKDRKPWDADFNNLNVEMIRRYGRALDAEFSWQVLRSEYDKILLDHAVSLGVVARHGWRADAPIEEKGVVRGVVVVGPDGERRTLRCRMLADCSGQSAFLSKLRRTRKYRDDLKNVAGYAYFKGARWKFDYAGMPDKTKIFICSVPEGWFWYIPIARDVVSVGLVSPADYVKRKGVKDYRAYYFKALKACGEIAPLVAKARLLDGVDPAQPGKDFFSAGDWSFESERACGPGWIAAGDAAFFLDPLLSSGVMMAHLSGHRAAYTIRTAWRERDAKVRAALWADYDRFCREVAGSFLALVRYWYHYDPNARAWWGQARRALRRESGLDLSDKMSFVAVAAGLTYYFERSYTSQTMSFGTTGKEHTWQWEGTKLELKRWTRQIIAIVETGFLEQARLGTARVRRAEQKAALSAIPDSCVPVWRAEPRKSVTFLPGARDGLLRPIARLDFPTYKRKPDPASDAASPKRVLPPSFLEILRRVDGRRSVGEIKARLYAALDLPKDVIDGQVFRIFKDLAVLGALELEKTKAAAPAAVRLPAWRRGEDLLRRGDPGAAEKALTEGITRGEGGAWALALRGEARRHLGRPREAARDLDEALARLETMGAPRARGLEPLLASFGAEIERSWLEDRARVLRAKLRLSLGDARGAREDAEAAARVNPRQSEALVLRARASLALGEPVAAREDLRAALAIESAGKKGEG